jgi:Flp pilus assembly protein TadD
MVKWFQRVVVCLLAVTAGGCAARQSERGIGDVLIKRGTPKVSMGTPAKAPEESLESYMQKVRHLAATSKSAPRDRATAAESWDPALKAALEDLAAGETADRHRAIAAAYRRLGVTDAAYTHLMRATQIDPTDAASYDALARLWRDWGLPHLALGDASRAVYHAPTSAAAHNTLGTIRQALGDREAARRAYRAALALDPGAAYALNNLCYVSLLDGLGGAARTACENATRHAPGLAAARNNLGLVHALSGNVTAAVKEFETAGDQAAGQYNLGVGYFLRGQYVDAARAFERAYLLRPSATAAAHARQARAMAGTGPN